MKKLLFLAFALAGTATAALAQPKKLVADKVVGIVGDRIILFSDIQNALADAVRNGQQLPEGAECQVMEQALVSKVLMLQAEKDSLKVTDEEVEADLDNRVRMFIRQYGTQEEVERLAGKSIYQIKDEARESVRERKLAEAMQRKIVDPIRITPAEVKAYFQRIPTDSLPFFESELEVGQIVVYPKASREIEKYTMDELLRLRQQIVDKRVSFAQAAKGSDDPGSRENGGQYQINRTEKTWDPNFVAGAFRLKEGEISGIVKTQFGYHIIQMVSRNGDDAIVRHILKTPPVTDEDLASGVAKLDSVRAKMIAGTLSFQSAADKYTEDQQAKFAGPFLLSNDGDTYNRIDELDKDVVAVLGRLKIGEYSQPQVFMDERAQKKGVRILYLKSRSEPHRMNLRDDYNKISQAALEEKKFLALDKWLNTRIPTYYIMVDATDFECPRLDRWTKGSNTAGR